MEMKIVVFFFFTCFVAISFQDGATHPRFRLSGFFKNGTESTSLADLTDQERSLTKPQGRFLFWPWNLLFTTSNYLTSTMYVTISTTMTSIVIARCIPATVFTNAAAQAASCRRRRQAPHLQLEFKDEFSDPSQLIAPSDVEHMAASVSPSMDRSARMLQPEIHSSRDDDANGRNLGLLVAAYTSTITSFSITTTTFKTTAYIASGTSLYCVPYGYTVC